jgi:hypothetical protein
VALPKTPSCTRRGTRPGRTTRAQPGAGPGSDRARALGPWHCGAGRLAPVEPWRFTAAVPQQLAIVRHRPVTDPGPRVLRPRRQRTARRAHAHAVPKPSSSPKRSISPPPDSPRPPTRRSPVRKPCRGDRRGPGPLRSSWLELDAAPNHLTPWSNASRPQHPSAERDRIAFRRFAVPRLVTSGRRGSPGAVPRSRRSRAPRRARHPRRVAG